MEAITLVVSVTDYAKQSYGDKVNPGVACATCSFLCVPVAFWPRGLFAIRFRRVTPYFIHTPPHARSGAALRQQPILVDGNGRILKRGGIIEEVHFVSVDHKEPNPASATPEEESRDGLKEIAIVLCRCVGNAQRRLPRTGAANIDIVSRVDVVSSSSLTVLLDQQ